MRIVYSFNGFLVLVLMLAGCSQSPKTALAAGQDSLAKGSYGYDLQFLKNHTRHPLELQSRDGLSKVLLSADYQGRVMSSSAAGDTGTSFGWINYSLISQGTKKKAFNPVGGEERFWLGPEGGQYSLYFHAGDSFNIAHWQVPAFLDTLPYEVLSQDSAQVVFGKKVSFSNYSGTEFNISIQRAIQLVSREEIQQKTGWSISPNLKFVGFQSQTRISNSGEKDWTPQGGLLSVWLLGMFTPSPRTTVIIPFSPRPGYRKLITDNYFGEIPAARLQVGDSVLFFTCDGNYRSKIGLSPLIAKNVAGSFDFSRNLLTLVFPQVVPGAPYVNSKWEWQSEPYKGDVVNSYNDGPLADGTQMGPFYEVESSSPALQLKKGASGAYTEITCHFQGDYESLRKLAQQSLGVDLNQLKK